MRRKNLNGLYSTLAVAFFLLIAAGSARVNKLHCGAMSQSSTGETHKNGMYLILKDGTEIEGDRITWKAGLLSKEQIKIDDQKFAIKETRGYYSNGTYYGRVGRGDYAERIVHGARLNVYFTKEWVTSTSTSRTGMMRTSQRLVCTHYVQRGEEGELEAIANQKDILKYVGDCKIAAEMIDKKDKEIRRSIRKNSMYLNNIFIVYNNDCRE